MVTEVIATTEPVGLRRISWGAIAAGGVAALATWALLYSLGIAIGLSTVNEGENLRGTGIFSGVWGGLSPLVALFIGGLVAGRASGTLGRGLGGLHGFVTWAVTMLAGAWIVGSLLSSLVGGLFSAGKTVAQAGGAAVTAAAGAGEGAAKSVGINADDLLGPVNQRLQSQGKPAVTAEQLRAATSDATRESIRTGKINREQLVQSLSTQTSLSRADAEDIADRAQGQLQQLKGQAGAAMATAKEKAQAGAIKAADVSSKAMWGVFIALALGLIAAVVGGALGALPLKAQRLPQPRRPVRREVVREGPSLTGGEAVP